MYTTRLRRRAKPVARPDVRAYVVRVLITAEVRRLQIAAHWADLHPGEAVPVTRLPGTEHPVRLGGEGTPTAGDFAAAELGCVLRISDGSAARLIADALDLRHRLPLIWAAALAGQVPAHQARPFAAAIRHLSCEPAASVDRHIAPSLGGVSWAGCKPSLRPPSISCSGRCRTAGGRRRATTVRAAGPQVRAWFEVDHWPRRSPGMRSGSKPLSPPNQPNPPRDQPRTSAVSMMLRRQTMPTCAPPSRRLSRRSTVSIGRCRSCRRRSTQTGPGHAPRSMCISAPKPSPPAPALPASKTSDRCYWADRGCSSAGTARSA